MILPPACLALKLFYIHVRLWIPSDQKVVDVDHVDCVLDIISVSYVVMRWSACLNSSAVVMLQCVIAVVIVFGMIPCVIAGVIVFGMTPWVILYGNWASHLPHPVLTF